MAETTVKPAIKEQQNIASNSLYSMGIEVKKRFIENLLGFSDDVTDYTHQAELLRVMRQVPDVVHSAGKTIKDIYEAGKIIKDGVLAVPPIIGKLAKNKALDFSNEVIEYLHKAENASSCKEAFQVMSEWGKKVSKGKLAETAFGAPAAITAFYYAAPLFAATPLLSYIFAVLGGATMGMGLGQAAQLIYQKLSGNKIESSINAENLQVTAEENKIREAILAAGDGKLTEELQKHLAQENLESTNIRKIQLDMAVNKYSGIKEGVKFGGTAGGAVTGGLVSSCGLLGAIKSAITGGNVLPNSHSCLSNTGLAMVGGKAGVVLGSLTFEALAGLAGIALYLISKGLDDPRLHSWFVGDNKLAEQTVSDNFNSIPLDQNSNNRLVQDKLNKEFQEIDPEIFKQLNAILEETKINQ